MYSKVIKHYKKFMLIPLLIFILSLVIIGNNYAKNGEIVDKGIDFKGGSQIIVELSKPISLTEVKKTLSEDIGGDNTIRTIKGTEQILLIDIDKKISKDEIEGILDKNNIEYRSISMQSIGAALGEAFWHQAQIAIVIAFLAMALVVFITFRSVVPSLAIILAGSFDIIFAIAGMDLLGIKLSLGTLAALLILIGYSVDTDILLSTRLLKRKGEGDLDSRIISSMKTGVTMTITGISAFVVLYLVSTSVILDQIALVIILGLLADLPYTWIQNMGILKWHLKRE
jgi:preprotein translocase subunit SecF